MRALVALFLCVASVAGANGRQARIIGGAYASIDQFPSVVGLLYSYDSVYFTYNCGGAILNYNSVLTAAYCLTRSGPENWRIRAGSSYANSGGTVYPTSQLFIHPDFYNPAISASDIAVVRSGIPIEYVNQAVQPGTFVGANYYPADNDVVVVAGWGYTEEEEASELLLQAETSIMNQEECQIRYEYFDVLDSVVCTAGLGDQCNLDYGTPVFHNNYVFAVTTSNIGCGHPEFPTISTRVGSYIDWIQENA